MRSGRERAVLVAGLLLATTFCWPVIAAPRAQQATDLLGPAYQLVETWSAVPSQAPPGYLLEPTALVAAADGTLYILDGGRGRIEVYRGGIFERSFGQLGSGPAQLREPRGMALIDDRILVADTGNRRIQLFTVEGRHIGTWTGLGTPWGIAKTTSGEIAVTDYQGGRVLFMDESGRVRRALQPRGPHELAQPQAIAGLPDGGLALVDSGHRRVQLWRGDGSVAGLITSTSLLPQVSLASAGDEQLIVAELRTLYVYDTVSLRPTASSRAPVPGGFLAVAVAPGQTTPPTIWAALRSDQLSGLRRYEGLSLSMASEDLHLPAPPLEFHGPQRIETTASLAYVLDSLPRVQRLSLVGGHATQTLVTEAAELATAENELFVASGNLVRRLQGLTETWRWQAAPDSWINGLAFDAKGERLFVLDLPRQAIVALKDGQPILTTTLAAGEFNAYVDLAMARADTLALVNRGHREIELRRLDGAVEARWPVRGAPLRIAFDPDGRGYVLTREGWVWRYDLNGEPDAWWNAALPLASGEGRGTPTDLAVTGDGRALITDGPGQRVLVFAPQPLSRSPAPPSASGCRHWPEKWAEPTYLNLGQQTTVTLKVTGECVDEGRAADIVLVLDRSGSMAGQKMAAARSAAITFVSEMNFAVSRVGVVAFSSQATTAIGLSTSPADVIAAIVGIESPTGGTNIGAAIELAAAELEANGRPEVDRIIVLMSDGRPEGDVIDADTAAAQAKSAGIRIFTIGFGGDVDPELMRRLASTRGDYFFAPSTSELSAVYAEIARRVSSDVTIRRATITDVVPLNMAYIEGSARPPVTAMVGRELRWELADIRSLVELRYRLRPLETGLWPTNVVARSRHVDGHDAPGELEFPVPQVRVVGPARPVFLPFAANRLCIPGDRPADAVLVVDSSSSMRGDKLRAAQLAAHGFVDNLRPQSDRAAIVSFNLQAQLAIGLTADREALHGAINRLSAVTGTVIDEGLRLGLAELQARGRPDAAWALVLLSDGQNNAGREPVLIVGEALRRAGVTVFSVAFGEDADRELLCLLAGDPARCLDARSAEELVRLFALLAQQVACP